MTDKLPPLPINCVYLGIDSGTGQYYEGVEGPHADAYFDAEQMQEYARQAVREAVPEGFTEDQVSWAAIRAGIGNVVCGRLIDVLKLIAAAKEAK